MTQPNNIETKVRNRLKTLFENQTSGILSVFFTAGFPRLEDTAPLILALQSAGVDMIEVGIPFSDPIADGEVIQISSQKALENGITLEKIFEQLASIADKIKVPIIFMGYLNPIYQFGWQRFCMRCAEVGVDGLILPDLPMDEFEEIYKDDLIDYGLKINFLVTPQTSESRISRIDDLTSGFIYVVSSASTTGGSLDMDKEREEYFHRISKSNLKNKRLIGFGIRDHHSFQAANRYAEGAIIGSAFIKHIENGYTDDSIKEFVSNIRNDNTGK